MIRSLIFILISFQSFGQTIDENYQLLWEISGNGLKKKSYIFGSYHQNDRRLFNWTDSMYYALNKVDAVALETDVFSLFDEWDTRRTAVNLKFDNQGNPYTASGESSVTAYGDEDGMPQFLDAHLQQYCYNAGKRFHPLEDIDFQLNAFSDVDFPSSDFRLESLLISKEDILETYIEGDIHNISELTRLSLSLNEGLYESLIVQRNFSMTDRLDSILQVENSLFCAVGAAHLAGPSGMINLLKSKGYTMRKVLATYSDDVSIDRLEVRSKRYYTYQNDSIPFTAQFPGKPKEISDEPGKLQLIYRDFGQGNTYSVDVYERNDESSLEDFARVYIASPEESPYRKVTLDNGGDAFEGISDAYPEGMYWTRVMMGQDHLLVIKAYGGNKFMNSNRAQRFFDRVAFSN